MTDQLSPAAQSVLDAFLYAMCNNKCSLAAILRAAAEQSENFYDPHEGKVSAVRTDLILAIAAELDNS